MVLKQSIYLVFVLKDAFGDSMKKFLGNVVDVLDFTVVEDHV